MANSFMFCNSSVLVAGRVLNADDDLVLEHEELLGAGHITSVLRTDKVSGAASAVLKQATDWADREGLHLSLIAHAGVGLTQAQLVSWYQRNGFEIASGNLMIRYPLTVSA